LAFSSRRMRNPMGNLIPNGPNGCTNCVVPVSLVAAAWCQIRGICLRRQQVWWMSGLVSILCPLPRQVKLALFSISVICANARALHL
uniref:Secreted protein n=1 Tax=Schistocephalus solidus TaxID=70667 RepID=A0A183S9R2_SCHSO